MNLLTDILGWTCLLAGGFVIITGAIGLLRLPDFYTRLHAAGVIDTLGCMLIILGLLFQTGVSFTGIKLCLIIVFILFTTPTAAHALAKAALHGNLKPLVTGGGEQLSRN